MPGLKDYVATRYGDDDGECEYEYVAWMCLMRKSR